MISIVAGTAALATSGGIASASGGGGLTVPDPPVIRELQCIEKCADVRVASEGSRIQLTGARLDGVDEVIFAKGISTAPASTSENVVEAKVPAGAETGTVAVSAHGTKAESEQQLRIVKEDAIPEAGEFKLSSAEATPHKTFFDGKRSPQVAYLFQGAEATDVRIDVLKAGKQRVVDSFVDRGAEPNTRNVARWNGRTSSGRLAPNGEYVFRVGSVSGGAKTTPEARFGYYQYRFPVRAKHDYGDGFGAGRGHQGQDVFAQCGSKLVAARGGRVQWNKVHSSAGNYLVIDGKGTSEDFMYAHLQSRSPLQQGERVHTGETIGKVGDTGNASGCHLHFEVWSAPGWYEGGDPLAAVTKMLKAWDGWS